MNDITLATDAVAQQIYAAGLAVLDRIGRADRHDRDRGAVSLEQVLWFAAAGVSVAVIAAILWNQIKDKANDPIISPSAP